MTSAEVRAGINERQAALAKMGGGKRSNKRRTYKRRTYKRLCTCKKSCNKRSCNCNKRRSKHHSRKRYHRIRGGAVAPTTTGGSQEGSNKLFMAQQQAGANRAFDTPNKV